jgi:hypothetical protein
MIDASLTPDISLDRLVFCVLLAGWPDDPSVAGQPPDPPRGAAPHQVPAAFNATIDAGRPPEGRRLHHRQNPARPARPALGAAMLLGWTLLGGLNALNHLLLGWLGHRAGAAAGAAGGFFLMGPCSSCRWPGTTFRIEQRFGFNKMTLGCG